MPFGSYQNLGLTLTPIAPYGTGYRPGQAPMDMSRPASQPVTATTVPTTYQPVASTLRPTEVAVPVVPYDPYRYKVAPTQTATAPTQVATTYQPIASASRATVVSVPVTPYDPYRYRVAPGTVTTAPTQVAVPVVPYDPRRYRTAPIGVPGPDRWRRDITPVPGPPKDDVEPGDARPKDGVQRTFIVMVEGRSEQWYSSSDEAAKGALDTSSPGDRFEIFIDGRTTGLRVRTADGSVLIGGDIAERVRAMSRDEIAAAYLAAKRGNRRVVEKGAFPWWLIALGVAGGILVASEKRR